MCIAIVNTYASEFVNINLCAEGSHHVIIYVVYVSSFDRLMRWGGKLNEGYN